MLRIRLVIADRRPIVLQGFASLFAAEHDFEIVASCVDGAGCLEAVRRLTPDVVLVEDGFSDVTASEMLAAVTAEKLPTRLVFYTASVAHGDLAAAIEAGACSAIPMREEPETLMQSLRLVVPPAGRAAASKAGNGAFGKTGLAALTDHERKIMRLVACGMSNKEIARQLKVAPGTIKVRLDHISAQLEIKSRTELAAFALSRLFGGIGALAALIWAALDDVQDASATAFGHANTVSVTVMAADGTGAVVTIKIDRQKTTAALVKTAKALGKAGRIENSIGDMPMQAGRPIESRADSAVSTISLPTLNPPRPGLTSGTFLMTTVGVLLYEFLNSPAQAFNFCDSLSDFSASVATNGTSELMGLNHAASAEADLGGLDNLAWLNPEIHQDSFVFEAARSDTIGRSEDFQIIDAAASQGRVSGNGNSHVGSGAVDALVDHGGFDQTAAKDASTNAEHDTIQLTAVHGADRDQSPRGLPVSEEDEAAGKPHAEHGPPGHDSDHAQSQRDLHASKGGSSAAEKHVKDDVSGSHANSGQSQRDVHEGHSNASKNVQGGPSEHAGGNGHSTDASAPVHAPGPGDSFHFKNDMAEAKASDHSGDSHGHNTIGYGLHNAGHHEPAQIQDADLIGPSHAEQGAVDHTTGVVHHPTHDFFV
ncbi:LuxR C-terminal-related transcriptional regulator [Bradyrhizobium sp. LLZ17]|uniref:LuxR C-terminal-related transcriptional regulator n=1 Tax=Bradyrhizobium sp. LLZ17 TaxID=3239388 RepID=A0AB39XNG4_9BRAD